MWSFQCLGVRTVWPALSSRSPRWPGGSTMRRRTGRWTSGSTSGPRPGTRGWRRGTRPSLWWWLHSRKIFLPSHALYNLLYCALSLSWSIKLNWINYRSLFSINYFYWFGFCCPGLVKSCWFPALEFSNLWYLLYWALFYVRAELPNYQEMLD